MLSKNKQREIAVAITHMQRPFAARNALCRAIFIVNAQAAAGVARLRENIAAKRFSRKEAYACGLRAVCSIDRPIRRAALDLVG